MRKSVRVSGYLMATLVGAFIVLAIVVTFRWKRTFDAPYPAIAASSDPAVIEAGRYLAEGPGHCADCHTDKDAHKAALNGAKPPLTGGLIFKLPVGNFYTPNITPDKETGIGRYSDGELARVLRHGVLPDGRSALPFMETAQLSDQDLTALISWLRAQAPVRRQVPQHDVNFIGKTMLAFVIEPRGPANTPPKTSPPQEATVERGKYLANSVASCAGCHTQRSMLDGSFVNARFSGGNIFPIDGDDSRVVVSPNLTPSKKGWLAQWDEERFVGRFGIGMGIPESHMPWRSFAHMSQTDVRALYRYLRSLEPVENETGPLVQPKNQKS